MLIGHQHVRAQRQAARAKIRDSAGQRATGGTARVGVQRAALGVVIRGHTGACSAPNSPDRRTAITDRKGLNRLGLDFCQTFGCWRKKVEIWPGVTDPPEK